MKDKDSASGYTPRSERPAAETADGGASSLGDHEAGAVDLQYLSKAIGATDSRSESRRGNRSVPSHRHEDDVDPDATATLFSFLRILYRRRWIAGTGLAVVLLGVTVNTFTAI